MIKENDNKFDSDPLKIVQNSINAKKKVLKNEYTTSFNANNFASIDINNKVEIINEDAINKKKSFISSKMGNHLRIQDGNISANNSKRQINIINNVFINNNQIIVHNNF